MKLHVDSLAKLVGQCFAWTNHERGVLTMNRLFAAATLMLIGIISINCLRTATSRGYDQ